MNVVSSYSLLLAACISWSQRASVKLLVFAAPLTSAGTGALLRKLYHDTQCSSQWEKRCLQQTNSIIPLSLANYNKLAILFLEEIHHKAVALCRSPCATSVVSPCCMHGLLILALATTDQERKSLGMGLGGMPEKVVPYLSQLFPFSVHLLRRR